MYDIPNKMYNGPRDNVQCDQRAENLKYKRHKVTSLACSE